MVTDFEATHIQSITRKKTRLRSAYEESQLQINCIKWFDYQYPTMRKTLFAIPNGGKRNRREAGRMKAEGVRAGTWDLFLAAPRGVWAGMFIEMKMPGGVLSDSQKEFRDEVSKQYLKIVVYSFDEFKNNITDYLK